MHSVDEHKNPNTDRRERAIGVALLVLGLAVAGGALLKLHREPAQLAQVQPSESAPAAMDQSNGKPAEAMPGGTRPTTPAPEPARPQAQPGQTTGSAPAQGAVLPPAPAEKIAPPLERK
jgi:hypothetical protein